MEEDFLDRNISSKSKISALFNQTVSMLKTPSINHDLIKILDEVLKKVNEVERYTNHCDVMSFKFVEVALLLQYVADLYGKKIDLLWDLIFDYQKQLVSLDKNNTKNEEITKIEEHKQKYKRKRKIHVQDDLNMKLANNVSFGYVDDIDYINQTMEAVDLSTEWCKFKPKLSSDKVVNNNKSIEFLPDDSIYNDQDDYIGRYDQFHSRFLLDEIFYLEKDKLLVNDNDWIVKMKVDIYAINDFFLKNDIPVNTSSKSYSNELQDYINNFIALQKQPIDDAHTDQIVKASYVCLERLPFNVMRDKLRRGSTADSLLDDELIDTAVVNELQDSIKQTFDPAQTTLENRSKSCSQDSAFFEDIDEFHCFDDSEVDHVQDIHSNKETEPNNNILHPIDEGRELPNYQYSQMQNNEETEVKNNEEPKVQNNEEPKVQNNEEAKAQNNEEAKAQNNENAKAQNDELNGTTNNSNNDSGLDTNEQIIIQTTEAQNQGSKRTRIKKQWDVVFAGENEMNEVPEIKKRRKSIRLPSMKHLITGITVDYDNYERFCLLHYRPEEGEGNKLQPDIHTDEEDDSESNVSSSIHEEEEHQEVEEEEEEEAEDNDGNYDDDHIVDDEEENEDIDKSCLNPLRTSSPIDNLNESDNNTKIDLQQNNIIESTSFSTDTSEQENLRKNIRNWHSFIIPKLRKLEGRSDFDIHQYGQDLIDPIPIGEKKHFKDLMNGKSAPDVTRNFIAILQLANTNNIEILGNVPGKVSNDSFEIKVLSKTKHHELLETYQAPSEKQRYYNMPSNSMCGKDPPKRKLKCTLKKY